jgi:hypothetical protein
VLRGTEAIRAYPRVRPSAGPRTSFAGVVATGRKFAFGEQRVLGLDPRTVIGGDLALTSTRLPDGTVTAGSLPQTAIRGRPPPGRRHLALGHRQVPPTPEPRPGGRAGPGKGFRAPRVIR